MKRILAALALCTGIFAGAQNLVMNGNFKMGTMGFAQQRALRFDTNPGQKYIPIETVKLPDGGFALKITILPLTSLACFTMMFSKIVRCGSGPDKMTR